MSYDNIPPFEERYHAGSHYGGRCEEDAIGALYGPDRWPQDGCFEKFRRDAALLKEALSGGTEPPDAPLAEQVFGSQARQQKIGLGHLANVLHERATLHQKHLRDIDWRLNECKDRLSVLRMQFPLDGGRPQQHLEKLILELERQRHEEEISFWKDTAEIRQQLFDSAAIYSATRRRKDMLWGVEGQDD